MAATARIALSLSASQSPASSAFVSGGLNYGLNGLDQAFAASEIDQVFIQEFSLAAGVETVLDLADMNGGNDGLGEAYAAGSIVAVIVQVAAGLVTALPQHVLVRGLGGPANEKPVESDASRVGIAFDSYPGGLPVTSMPELRFESLNGASDVAVFILCKTGTGSAVPDRTGHVNYRQRHLALNAAAASYFFRIPAGHVFVPTSYSALVEDAALATGTTDATIAVGYSADGAALTSEWAATLTPDAETRFETVSLVGSTMPNGTGWVYMRKTAASDSTKKVTLSLDGYLMAY